LGYIKEFFSNKNLTHSYIINTLLHFFFGWMIIYTPIYLSVHLHFTWMEISKMFAIMLVPFLILPYSLGKYSDKIGERKMLMVGFTIMALSSILAFFITRHEVLIWALVLFMTRIGAATVEAMSDSYFFKHVTSEQEQFVGVYRSSPSVAYIIAPIVAFIVFSVTPTFNFIYLILGVVMLYGTYLSSTINRSDI
jgi:MFS family permease